MGQTLPMDGGDDLLAVLANEEYRGALSELRTEPNGVKALSDLPTERRTHDSSGIAATPSRLHHVVLRKLEDIGLIDYDTEEHTVRYRPSESAKSWLQAIERRSK